MIACSTSDVTDLLRGLPDMKPPADAWSRLQAARKESSPGGRLPLVWPAVAVAACAALLAFGLRVSSEQPVAPVLPSLETGLAARGDPIGDSGVSTTRADDLGELRQQSRQLERRLAGLPRRSEVVRADVAAMIGELQDRIAAVDYELNRARPVSAATARWPSAAPAAIYAIDRVDGYEPGALWQERVQLMNRLVSVRFAEAGAAAY